MYDNLLEHVHFMCLQHMFRNIHKYMNEMALLSSQIYVDTVQQFYMQMCFFSRHNNTTYNYVIKVGHFWFTSETPLHLVGGPFVA